MALDERSRHELFLRLEAALGPDAATTLMEHLPPTGWADVATKRDLDALESRFELRIEALEHKLLAAFRGELQTSLTAQGRQLVIALVGSTGAVAAVALTAARLT
jgi:hypothetical protein